MTEDEMVGWHHRLNGHGFGWTPGVGDGQGGLACCGLWSCKESDTTERLHFTLLYLSLYLISRRAVSLKPRNIYKFEFLFFCTSCLKNHSKGYYRHNPLVIY